MIESKARDRQQGVTIALHAVTREDYMTAGWACLLADLLARWKLDRQQGAGCQPRRLRYLKHAAGDERVGLILLAQETPSSGAEGEF
jgi:hypothetical protein